MKLSPLSLFSISCCALVAAVAVQSAEAAAIVIDNGDAGYSVVGVTEQVTAAPGTVTYGNDHAFNTTGNDLTAVADYTFSGLTNGTYEVFASWRQGGQNNTGLMTISVSDARQSTSTSSSTRLVVGPLETAGRSLTSCSMTDRRTSISSGSVRSRWLTATSWSALLSPQLPRSRSLSTMRSRSI